MRTECWIPRHTWNQLFQCGTAKEGGTRQRRRRRRHQTQQLDNIGFGKHNTFFSSTSSFFSFFFDDDRRKRVKMSICIAVKRSGRDRFGSSYDELSYVNYPARLIAVNESKAREGSLNRLQFDLFCLSLSSFLFLHIYSCPQKTHINSQIAKRAQNSENWFLMRF